MYQRCIKILSSLSWLKKIPIFIICIFALNACHSKVGVSIGAVGHLGGNVGISDFYVNGAWGGNNSGQTIGNSGACCVVIPQVWHAGLQANVEWEECDTSDILFDENGKRIDPDTSKACKKSEFKESVPIPKYEQPGNLYVHFFPEHKVAVVVSPVDPRNPAYPWPVMKGYYRTDAPEWAKAKAIGVIKDKRNQ